MIWVMNIVIPEFVNRFNKLKGKNLLFKEMDLKQDRLFILMISLELLNILFKKENIFKFII